MAVHGTRIYKGLTAMPINHELNKIKDELTANMYRAGMTNVHITTDPPRRGMATLLRRLLGKDH